MRNLMANPLRMYEDSSARSDKSELGRNDNRKNGQPTSSPFRRHAVPLRVGFSGQEEKSG